MVDAICDNVERCEAPNDRLTAVLLWNVPCQNLILFRII